MANSELAAVIGTEYARMLHGILPKIEDSIKRGKKTASFQVTAKFRVLESGAIDVTLSQTATIPMDSSSFKLSYNSGQLSLFEPKPPAE
jgi:hypothetical protein